MATGLIYNVWEPVYYMSELRCLLPWQQPKMGPGDSGTGAMAQTSLAARRDICAELWEQELPVRAKSRPQYQAEICETKNYPVLLLIKVRVVEAQFQNAED